MNEIGYLNSLSTNYIYDIFQDNAGSLWIGTFGGGLNKIDPLTQYFIHYRTRFNDENSLINNAVWSILHDGQNLWIGTDNGLDRLNRKTGKFTHFQHDPNDPTSLSANNIQAIHKRKNGDFWIGIGGAGLNRFDPEAGVIERYQNEPDNPKSISADYISAIVEDQKGELWIGTNKGLNLFLPKTNDFAHFSTNIEEAGYSNSDRINTIYPTSDGHFWVGTHAGLSHFDPQNKAFIEISGAAGRKLALSDMNILSIFEDTQNLLWIGTVGKGLIRYDPINGEMQIFHEKEGLPNETIYGILPDNQNNLWMSTNKGLAKFYPELEKFQKYTSKDGLQDNEFNSYAFCKELNGELFFGGINGVTAFLPDDIRDNTTSPPVELISLRLNGKSNTQETDLELQKEVVLRWPENSFDFEFASLNYIQPEENEHAYKLEFFDSDWNYVGTRNFGRYTNLPGGNFQLHLKASNNAGIWNEEGKVINIRVIPPIWQTIWFKLLVAIFGVTIFFAGYRIRVRSVENRSVQLEELVQERTREIDIRRQELEALYSADETIYRNLELDQVLEALVEAAIKLLEADKGALFVLDDDKKRLNVRVAYGFFPETISKLSTDIGNGVVGAVAQTGEPVIIQDTLSDPRVRQEITGPENICALMQVPIKVGGEVFGVFSADFVKPHHITTEELK